jgi:phosphatidylserine decarboxylase
MLGLLRESGIQLSEFEGNLSEYDTPRKIFERQIRYWNCRPMHSDQSAVVCPADARALLGSMRESSGLFLTQKFFPFPELLGENSPWQNSFEDGDYAVLRLTPEKYHYTHSPVSGRVLDIYSVEGLCYSCNPGAAVQLLTPFSKNRRVVTVFDTDCAGGSAVGRVAMIEVVALMVGQIEQRYSEYRYENPRPLETGMFLRAGAPKALFRPGSSTVVLLFQPNRIRFADDLVENQRRGGVQSRFSVMLGQPLIETDVAVRSLLATPAGEGPS